MALSGRESCPGDWINTIRLFPDGPLARWMNALAPIRAPTLQPSKTRSGGPDRLNRPHRLGRSIRSRHFNRNAHVAQIGSGCAPAPTPVLGRRRGGTMSHHVHVVQQRRRAAHGCTATIAVPPSKGRSFPAWPDADRHESVTRAALNAADSRRLLKPDP